jgi:hypothetical protein
MRPGSLAGRLSVRLSLKRKVVSKKHQDGPYGEVVRTLAFEVERLHRAAEG